MTRRALADEMPALSHFYGLKPWDVMRLTRRELNEYREQYHAAHNSQE